MPKNDTIPNDTTPNDTTPNDENAAVEPATNSAKRKLGTGAIIGVSAAGVALLAGVFGGGIALGAAAATHGPSGMSHEMGEAAGPTQRDGMQGGPMQGGPMQGGPQHFPPAN